MTSTPPMAAIPNNSIDQTLAKSELDDSEEDVREEITDGDSVTDTTIESENIETAPLIPLES